MIGSGLLATLSIGCTSAPDPTWVPSPATSWNDAVSSQIRTGLSGARVREGEMWYLKHDDCGPVVLELGTCFGAHPASPYGMFVFPEDVDPDSDDLPHYRMDPDEAILFVGHTPPTSRYYSFNHHLYRQVRPDGTVATPFATVAPSLHMLEISTVASPMSGGLRDIGSVPFQDYTVVILTANQTTAARLTALLTPILASAGYGPEIINLHPIAYADADDAQALVAAGDRAEGEVFSLNMGYGATADTFNDALRVAAPVDPDHPYLFPETVNAAVFKIAFDAPPDHDPFPWPDLPPPPETGEVQPARLVDAQEALIDAVIAELVPAAFETVRVDTPIKPQATSAGCILEDGRCGANNDDARYHLTFQPFVVPSLDSSGSVFVVGVNHTTVARFEPQAPRVTYTSLTLKNTSRSFGVHTLLDHELEGSVGYWFDPSALPAGVDLPADQLDTLYVIQYARDCSQFGWEARYGRPNPYCIEFDDQLLGVCLLDKFLFTERVYLNQTSGTAPSMEAVYPPIALGVGPEVEWIDPGQRGAWTLSTVPATVDVGDWCWSADGG